MKLDKFGCKSRNIPIIGEKYHFFDDGKLGRSRHYVAIVEGIYTSKYIRKKYPNVYRHWKYASADQSFYNIHAYNTDYFVKCRIPDYDKHYIWFARSSDRKVPKGKTGEGYTGWFSFNVDSWWQGGRLDIERISWKNFVETWELDENKIDEYDESTWPTNN